MFHKFNEHARRVIFFARYEASQLGNRTIEVEHLLLGLLREDKSLMSRLLSREQVDRLGVEIRSRLRTSDRVPTSVELPLGRRAKTVLDYVFKESEAFDYVGTEHMLAGILRAADPELRVLLFPMGLTVEKVHEVIKTLPHHPPRESEAEESLDEIVRRRVGEELSRQWYEVSSRSHRIELVAKIALILSLLALMGVLYVYFFFEA